MDTFLLYARILLKLFWYFGKGFLFSGFLLLIRKIICARRSLVRLVNQIFGIVTRELCSGSYQILKYHHFGNLYLQLGYVTVSFWVYHKTYTSKLLYTIVFPLFVFSVRLYLACVLCTQYSCIIVICTTCF